MRAVVFHGVGDIRYEPDWPETRPLCEGDVKIATAWCGICGTDMEDYKHGAIIPIDKPHPESGRQAPMVIGHEFSGVVHEVGPGVDNLKPGQKVAMECARACHHCYWCGKGEYASCINQVSIGQVDDGGMAEYFVIPAENCIPVPNDAPDDLLAVAEPLAVMVRGVRRGRVLAGDIVTVVGAGAIGLMGIAAARQSGASKVISIAHGGKRAEVASQMGATHILDSRDEGWHEEFMALTRGLGSDVVIDTGGNVEAMRLAVDLTRRRGRCVVNSVIAGDVSLSAWDLVIDEKEIIGTVAHSTDEEYSWAVQFILDGRIDPSPMITSRIALEDAVSEGFDKLINDRNQIKILVTPREELLP